MKRFLAVLPVVVLLAACGSGSSTVASNPQVQAGVAKADKQIAQCLPNPVTLISKNGRHKFAACAVPPRRQAAFEQCLERVVLSGYPTGARLKHGVEACLAKDA